MAVYTPGLLSAATYGQPISISQTSTPGDLIHTGPATRSTYHDVWAWVTNVHASDIVLTIEWTAATPATSLTIPATIGPVAVLVGNRIGPKETALAGTAAINSGSATVVGTGTSFTGLSGGDKVAFGSSTTLYEVDSVTSNTLMDLTAVFVGADLTASTLTQVEAITVKMFCATGASRAIVTGQTVVTTL